MGALTGKTAVVTGASGGIGRSIALALAAEGVDLCLLGRERTRLDAVGREAGKIYPSVRTSSCIVDLADIASMGSACEELLRACPAIDILVHSAGVIVPGGYADARIEDFDTQYFVNARSSFFLTQRLLPAIRERKGQVVFVNSSAAQQKAKSGLAAYAASKYALMALADSLRDEVNADGVRVISIYPGRTATAMQKRIYSTEGKAYKPDILLQPEDVARGVIAALAAPPTAEITDISIRPFQKG